MSFIQGALIQKLTQQLEELTQRVVVLEGGKSLSKHTGKANTLEAKDGSTGSSGGVVKGDTKEPLRGGVNPRSK